MSISSTPPIAPLIIVAVISLSCAASSAALGASAVALGRSGSGALTSGAARGFATLPEARAAAENNCSRDASLCSILETFRDSCIVVAARDDNSGYVVKFDHDLAVAHKAALAHCSIGGRGCKILEAFCDESPDTVSVARSDADVLELLLNWQACFTKASQPDNLETAVAACDRAGAFSRLRPREREKLARQRSKLTQARGQALENKGDPSASKAESNVESVEGRR